MKRKLLLGFAMAIAVAMLAVVALACGEDKKSKPKDPPHTSHTYVETVADKYLKTAADCTHKAVYYKSCSECGIKGEETFEYGEPQHRYDDDNYCTVCHYRRQSVGLEYEVRDNGAYVVGIGTCTDTDIYIVDTYQGKPVVGIRGGAFAECDKIKTVDIPKSVQTIGEGAFFKCGALESVVISKSVTSIGEQVFCGCNALKSLTVESGSAAFIGVNNCVIETATKTLVAGCNYSVIPNDGSVEIIGYAVFAGFDKIVNVTIPRSVTEIRAYAFQNCEAIESMTVENGNANYYSVDNCVIETATGALVAGCKNSVIPTDGSVKAIGEAAFAGCVGLESVVIPNSVTEIGRLAFADCAKLSSMVIPASVTRMDDYVFNNCSSLKIYCEVKTPPADWSENWDSSIEDTDSSLTVEWGHAEGGSEVCEHDFTETVKSECIKELPDCKHKAVYFKSCSKCGEKSTETFEYGDFGDHKYDYYGVCEVCSYHRPSAGLAYTVSGDTASVTGIGTCKDSTVYIADEYEGYPVTSIGEYAFLSKKISGVVIPDSVESIGYRAFDGCSLTSVTFGKGVTSIGENAFYYCTGIKQLNIGVNVKSIGVRAFSGAEITYLEIPDSVTSIGRYAFSLCRYLRKVVLGKSVQKLDEGAFMECYTLVNVSIPDSMIDIADTAFDECAKLEYNVYNNCNYLGNNDNPYAVLVKVNDTSITDFVVNEKTKIIHLNAFKGCSALTSVTLPNGLACIGTSAFSGCYQLNNIAIPNSVSLIKDNAFGGCSQIPLIEYGNGKYFGNSENPYLIFIDLVFAGIHDEIETCNVHKDTKFIMNGVFSYNTLKTVTVDSGNTVFHSDGNCIIETKSKTLKFGFQTSVIPTDGSVTSIAKYAFYNCNNLTSITIPDCVTIIEDYAFAECDKLKSVDFGKGVSRIEKYAFNNCKALANLTLGTSVTYMGSYVFRGCYALKDIQYDGSKEQWYAASEHASLSVDTGSYTVHCTDGDIVKRT